MKKFKLRVGIDVDDILFSCDQYAIDLANEEYGYEPPLSIEELDCWGMTGKRTDIIFKYFENADFYEKQPLIPGAKDFIHSMVQRAEIFFVTAVGHDYMSIRANRLMQEFPEVLKENIIMGYRKDMIDVDVLLDDGSHNIILSKSTYPVLMRKPWNQHMTGCLAVNNFGEFISLIDNICRSYSKTAQIDGNKVIGLVGPSGSGKTALLERIVAMGLADRPVSYTTRTRRNNEDKDAYHFVSRDEFNKIKPNLFETTSYAGEYYGSAIEEVNTVLQKNNVIMAIDICGAIALQKNFPDNTVLVFINRPKKEVVRAILDRDISNSDKTNRIISLSDEYKNIDLCDAVVNNNGTVEKAVSELVHIINS